MALLGQKSYASITTGLNKMATELRKHAEEKDREVDELVAKEHKLRQSRLDAGTEKVRSLSTAEKIEALLS